MNEEILTVLEGYKRASAFIERERRERLANMTDEESKAIFSALMDRSPTSLYSEEYLARRLASKVEVRKTFLLLAKAKGYI